MNMSITGPLRSHLRFHPEVEAGFGSSRILRARGFTSHSVGIFLIRGESFLLHLGNSPSYSWGFPLKFLNRYEQLIHEQEEQVEEYIRSDRAIEGNLKTMRRNSLIEVLNQEGLNREQVESRMGFRTESNRNRPRASKQNYARG